MLALVRAGTYSRWKIGSSVHTEGVQRSLGPKDAARRTRPRRRGAGLLPTTQVQD